MKVSDLVQDAGTGQLSHTKLWMNIAYASATLAFLRFAWVGGAPDADIWLIYLGVLGAHGTASKLISMRYTQPPTTNPE